MTINPTLLAQTTRSSVNKADAAKRVIKAYRDWYRAAPEVVNLYLLTIPTSTVRSRIRQEFEKNRHVQQLPVIDMLIVKSNMEFQETMNYWKQTAQLMKYFRAEEDDRVHVPKDFMTGFLEGRNN
ncbi:NADH-ubiquinone oxidoreductase 14.8 kDa subunit [Sphaerosporella brunnea]|uniref:NADH-ubiquinone oxidoreductase 14.8 kDa subunit n=1 Tax=Sphaerosporella brunnea TaxID=1250544 RepID=A0A5J5F7R3_9PEZI|nr:NADH-ubiquinone oxidoreductase 14.8 kDa subunit [Sphaerosporella brunnea]